MFSSQNVYAVILAGEEDDRLVSLTRALSTPAVPAQFARIAGEGSLLQQTVACYANVLGSERVVVVVASKWHELARSQLRKWRGVSLLARPLDSGDAVDVMLGLGRVMARDPDASVVVTPADSYVPKTGALLASLAAAENALTMVPIILAGVPINGEILGDRVLVPGPRLDGRVLSIRRVVEQVAAADIKRWKELGALWDTSIVIARAEALWHMAMHQMPADVATAAGLARAENAPALAFAAIRRRAAAEKSTSTVWQGDDVGVIAVQGSGWSAWRSPEQVMDSLRDPLDLEQLLSRIYQHQWGIDRPHLRRQFRREAKDRWVPSCAVLARRPVAAQRSSS
jgi:mannose-1-phosphate guanylyltransferase